MTKEDSIRMIHQILKYLNISHLQLSVNIGYKSKYAVYCVLNPKMSTTLSMQMADKICEKYPFFSKIYILTGEGSLLKEDNTVNADQQNINANDFSDNTIDNRDPYLNKLTTLIEEKFAQVTKAQEQIKKLNSILEERRKLS